MVEPQSQPASSSRPVNGPAPSYPPTGDTTALRHVLRRLILLITLFAAIATAFWALVTRLPWPHTMAVGWRTVIVTLATLLLGPVIIQAWRRPLEVLSIVTTTVAALVTVMLAAITSDLAKSTTVQAEGAAKIAQELALARAQQYQPHLYAWIERSINEGQYMLTVKNLGSGVAKQIVVKLDAQGQGYSRTYELLGPGQEITDFLGFLPGAKVVANLAVSCRDASEENLGWRYVQDLASAAVPTSQYAQTREALGRERAYQRDLTKEVGRITATLGQLGQQLEEQQDLRRPPAAGAPSSPGS